MTTKEAFDHLTSQRGWYKLCKINPETARSIKRNNKKGKASHEAIVKLLNSANYSYKPEIWDTPRNIKK